MDIQVVASTEAQRAQWLEWARAVCAYTEAGTEARSSAMARVHRLEAGICIDVDIYGLEDWAEEMGWV